MTHDPFWVRLVRDQRLLDIAKLFIGPDIALFASHYIAKPPGDGQAVLWHQDAHYWPLELMEVITIWLALDDSTWENGCLQVIKGSHRCGRIEHGRFGNQTGADPKRVDLILENLEHVYCEMEQGDALFFHANLLHSSDPNKSDKPRWLMICCYNSRHNPCNDLPGHPSYRYMEKWPDDRIVEVGYKQWTEMKSGAED